MTAAELIDLLGEMDPGYEVLAVTESGLQYYISEVEEIESEPHVQILLDFDDIPDTGDI